MEREDGSFFECRIPPFSLESKQEDGSSPHGFVVWVDITNKNIVKLIYYYLELYTTTDAAGVAF